MIVMPYIVKNDLNLTSCQYKGSTLIDFEENETCIKRSSNWFDSKSSTDLLNCSIYLQKHFKFEGKLNQSISTFTCAHSLVSSNLSRLHWKK